MQVNVRTLLTDRKARDEFRDRVEVVMAVFVLTGFAIKKYRSKHNPTDQDATE